MEPDDQRLAEALDGPGWDAPAGPAAAPDGEHPAPRPRRRVSRRRLRRRRRIGIAMLVAGGVIVLGGLWLLITGLLARAQLDTVRSEVRQLRSQISAGDLAAARVTAGKIARAHRAPAHHRPGLGPWRRHPVRR
jgi:hypothetical protein